MSGMRVVVLTGAGISADSGLATFRGGGGLWEGHRVEEVATPGAWAADPELVWRFYQLRRRALAGVEPNAGHVALTAFARRLDGAGHGFTLVTQNVDDLHERAGSEPIHMHGELLRLRCEACGESVLERESFVEDEWVPCAACGYERLRPDVVWFGEMPYAMDLIQGELSRATHFVSIGTSGVVYPAAGFLAMARDVGAKTYVNSLDEPENLSTADRFLPGRGVDVLPAFLDELAAGLGA